MKWKDVLQWGRKRRDIEMLHKGSVWDSRLATPFGAHGKDIAINSPGQVLS